MQWQNCKGESFRSCGLVMSQLSICQHLAEALDGSLSSPRSIILLWCLSTLIHKRMFSTTLSDNGCVGRAKGPTLALSLPQE